MVVDSSEVATVVVRRLPPIVIVLSTPFARCKNIKSCNENNSGQNQNMETNKFYNISNLITDQTSCATDAVQQNKKQHSAMIYVLMISELYPQ